MSEFKDLKEQFGSLGLYLIEKAEKEIREINQKTLYQKAQIKKNFNKKISDLSVRIEKQYSRIYSEYIINAHSSTILKLKQNILSFKNDLIKELKSDIKTRILQSIKNNYETYLKFLKNEISKFLQNIKDQKNFVFFFNERDFHYFKQNSKFVANYSIDQLKLIDIPITGGFKVYLENENIWYDKTIDNKISKNSTLIENQFAKNFSEKEIDNYIEKFDNFITQKKEKIQELLNEFSRT